MTTGPLIFLIAGEPSGDALGARLMAALSTASNGTVRFAGIGGDRMAAAGLESLFPMSDLTLFGALEVIPKAPHIFRRVKQTVAAIKAERPAAVVSIDVPGFAFPVHKRVGANGIHRIHFVAPTVWAYRAGRAKKVARILDHLLALLPFEPPYFEKEGLACTYVGHPVVECAAGQGDGPGFRRRHDIAEDTPLLCVLPGSRSSEIKTLLPIFRETVARLAATVPGLTVVVPTVPALADKVEDAVATWPVRTIATRGESEKFDAFAAANAALGASGTIALELAMANVPAVLTYRVHPLSAVWVRLLAAGKFGTLVNLVVDRRVVPELWQEECRPDRLADETLRVLTDRTVRAQQCSAYREALEILGGEGPTPSERAAETILRTIGLPVPDVGVEKAS